MKKFTICLILALIAISCYGQDHMGGYNSFTIQGNDDPGACLLTLSFSLSPNAVHFTEMVNNPNWDCTYQNLTFQSMFNNDPLTGQIDLVKDSVNPNKYKGVLTIADFTKYNGTACVNYVPYGFTDYYYLCRFKYGSITVQFLFLANPNTGVLRTDVDQLFFPLWGATALVPQNGTIVWKSSNQSFPHIVGMLYSQCGGWSTSIPSPSNEIYMTGTEYQSNQLNLHNLLNGFLDYSVVIRKKGAPANQYVTSFVYNDAFSYPPVSGNCSDLQITYGDVLPNMNYCRNGCDVTFFLFSMTFYSLQTSGFTYSGSLRG